MNKCCLIFCGVFFALIGIAGMVIGGIFPGIVHKTYAFSIAELLVVADKFDVTPTADGSGSYAAWDAEDTVADQKPNTYVREYWLGSITNLAAVKAGTAKMIMKDVGPFAFQLYAKKKEVSFDGTGKVTYWSAGWLAERLDQTCKTRAATGTTAQLYTGCVNWNDEINTVNLGYIVAIGSVGTEAFFTAAFGQSALVGVLDQAGTKLTSGVRSTATPKVLAGVKDQLQWAVGSKIFQVSLGLDLWAITTQLLQKSTSGVNVAASASALGQILSCGSKVSGMDPGGCDWFATGQSGSGNSFLMNLPLAMLSGVAGGTGGTERPQLSDTDINVIFAVDTTVNDIPALSPLGLFVQPSTSPRLMTLPDGSPASIFAAQLFNSGGMPVPYGLFTWMAAGAACEADVKANPTSFKCLQLNQLHAGAVQAVSIALGNISNTQKLSASKFMNQYFSAAIGTAGPNPGYTSYQQDANNSAIGQMNLPCAYNGFLASATLNNAKPACSAWMLYKTIMWVTSGRYGNLGATEAVTPSMYMPGGTPMPLVSSTFGVDPSFDYLTKLQLASINPRYATCGIGLPGSVALLLGGPLCITKPENMAIYANCANEAFTTGYALQSGGVAGGSMFAGGANNTNFLSGGGACATLAGTFNGVVATLIPSGALMNTTQTTINNATYCPFGTATMTKEAAAVLALMYARKAGSAVGNLFVSGNDPTGGKLTGLWRPPTVTGDRMPKECGAVLWSSFLFASTCSSATSCGQAFNPFPMWADKETYGTLNALAVNNEAIFNSSVPTSTWVPRTAEEANTATYLALKGGVLATWNEKARQLYATTTNSFVLAGNALVAGSPTTCLVTQLIDYLQSIAASPTVQYLVMQGFAFGADAIFPAGYNKGNTSDDVYKTYKYTDIPFIQLGSHAVTAGALAPNETGSCIFGASIFDGLPAASRPPYPGELSCFMQRTNGLFNGLAMPTFKSTLSTQQAVTYLKMFAANYPTNATVVPALRVAITAAFGSVVPAASLATVLGGLEAAAANLPQGGLALLTFQALYTMAGIPQRAAPYMTSTAPYSFNLSSARTAFSAAPIVGLMTVIATCMAPLQVSTTPIPPLELEAAYDLFLYINNLLGKHLAFDLQLGGPFPSSPTMPTTGLFVTKTVRQVLYEGFADNLLTKLKKGVVPGSGRFTWKADSALYATTVVSQVPDALTGVTSVSVPPFTLASMHADARWTALSSGTSAAYSRTAYYGLASNLCGNMSIVAAAPAGWGDAKMGLATYYTGQVAPAGSDVPKFQTAMNDYGRIKSYYGRDGITGMSGCQKDSYSTTDALWGPSSASAPIYPIDGHSTGSAFPPNFNWILGTDGDSALPQTYSLWVDSIQRPLFVAFKAWTTEPWGGIKVRRFELRQPSTGVASGLTRYLGTGQVDSVDGSPSCLLSVGPLSTPGIKTFFGQPHMIGCSAAEVNGMTWYKLTQVPMTAPVLETAADRTYNSAYRNDHLETYLDIEPNAGLVLNGVKKLAVYFKFLITDFLPFHSQVCSSVFAYPLSATQCAAYGPVYYPYMYLHERASIEPDSAEKLATTLKTVAFILNNVFVMAFVPGIIILIFSLACLFFGCKGGKAVQAV